MLSPKMKLISLSAVFLSLAACAGVFADEPVRILTINVRTAAANDGENGWLHRKKFVTALLAGGNYDFIGTQETLVHPNKEWNQMKDIAAGLPEYGVLGRSRDKTPDSGETNALFYKKERWQPDTADKGTFWLSGTPEIPGSKTDPKAGCPRIVTFGLFHELKEGKPSGRKIYVYNTHYDHRSEEARQRGAKQVMDSIAGRKEKDVPAAVMGDLNCGENSPAIRYMQGEPMTLDGEKITPPCRLTDTFRAVNPDAENVGTYHGFLQPHKDKIDFIFISAPLKTISSQIIRTQREGRYPTDHFPVEAVIAL
ncbi:MAG: endonuclease/exonuclease/phosphatase family protein [Planctomycetaceae bacterium]|jgi:endonuclease/exonuclease/phosphatase family metal-dependent hydrolase|nr:endonuclease/exonuclease/phosphatase family protein [Planctomycetaceae bacterium]